MVHNFFEAQGPPPRSCQRIQVARKESVTVMCMQQAHDLCILENRNNCVTKGSSESLSDDTFLIASNVDCNQIVDKFLEVVEMIYLPDLSNFAFLSCDEDLYEEGIRDSAVFPTNNDILCGRGNRCNSHPGNIKFREVVESLKSNYLLAGNSKLLKKQVTIQCLQLIKKYRGRFLEITGGRNNEWEEISDEKAREKISQRFRDRNAELLV